MNNKSAALFRAANIIIMDYPFEAALQSALSICDEAVVVIGQSQDDTGKYVTSLSRQYPGRVKTIHSLFHYNLMWQERWWTLAQSQTDAEWLAYIDADEVFHERDIAKIKSVMNEPDTDLISVPFIHFYGTGSYARVFSVKRATRFGRRSAGYRMRNWRSEAMPDAPACQMIINRDGREIDANNPARPCVHILNTPVYHYSWCRTPQARAISNYKMVDWYADGQKFDLASGRVPDVEPFDFTDGFVDLMYSDEISIFNGSHPAAAHRWMEQHRDGWLDIEDRITRMLENDSKSI